MIRRRNALLIFPTIFVAIDPEIDITTPYLLQLHTTRSAISGRSFFKQEPLEETPEQWIGLNEVIQSNSLVEIC